MLKIKKKKEKSERKKWLFLLCFLLFTFLIFPMALTGYLYNQAFGIRIDNTTMYYDYLKNARPGFSKTAASFNSDKGQRLKGYFYFYDKAPYKGLLVIAHGMGGGHDNYLAEAEYFASKGYLIFSYDSTGTNESEGENLIGLHQSTIDLHYALNFLETIPQLQEFPLLLYGHSWGGFAVAAVNNYDHNVNAVVSVSGFVESKNILKQQGKALIGTSVTLFMPYLNLYEMLLFGEAASYTGISGLKNTKANVMIIHSKNDTIVDYNDNYMKYYDEFSHNSRFTFLSLDKHGHNGVISPKANSSIKKIHKKKGLISVKNSKSLSKTDIQHYIQLDNMEKELILKLDTKIMNRITIFFDDSIKESLKN